MHSTWHHAPMGRASGAASRCHREQLRERLGGEGANLALRQPMVFLNIYMMQQPEAYVANSWELFDEQNNLKSDDTRAFLQNWVNAFAEWVYKF